MIIKIKKRDLIVLLILLVFLIIPIAYAAKVTKYFTVLVSIGNRGPTVFYVNISNVTLTAGDNTTIQIEFNVSDGDGYGDLSDATAQVEVTYNSITRTSSACSVTDYNVNYTRYICNISFPYYDNATSNWVINASVRDNSDNQSSNNSQSLEVYELSAMEIVRNLTFTGLNLGDVNQTPDNQFVLNNTGNFDFTSINITAHDLVGKTNSDYKIGVGNFTVNITDATAGLGMKLQNETSLNATGAALPHTLSAAALNANETIYFWLQVPDSSQITSQDYNSTTEWIVIVS